MGRTKNSIRDLEAVIRLDQTARAELIVAEAYGATGDAPRATSHLQRAFELDRSCAALVDKAKAFDSIRHTDALKSLLERDGVR
jgi:hypothetical protein